MKVVVGAAAALSFVLAAAPAMAQQATTRGAADFEWLVRRGELALQSALFAPPPPPHPVDFDAPQPERIRGFYPMPRLCMIARDWSGGYGLADTDLVVTDVVRPSRSSRVALGRVKLPFEGWTPFAHAGVGWWRPDPAVVPVLVNDTEYAVQLGAGAEVKIARRGAVAFEADYIAFYREEPQPQYIPLPAVLGVFAALRAQF